MDKIIIRRYGPRDKERLFALIASEGTQWDCYNDVEDVYVKALGNSITYAAFDGDHLCGYSRSVDDNGIYIYISDLLVEKRYRGRGIGQRLMEAVCRDYPRQTVYVLSDEDEFYEKKGYGREGSVFEVKLR